MKLERKNASLWASLPVHLVSVLAGLAASPALPSPGWNPAVLWFPFIFAAMSFLADPSQTSDVFLSELQEHYMDLSRDQSGARLVLRFRRSLATFWLWEAGKPGGKMGAVFPIMLAFILLSPPTCSQKDNTTLSSGCRAVTILDNRTVAYQHHKLLEIMYKIVLSPLPAPLFHSTQSLLKRAQITNIKDEACGLWSFGSFKNQTDQVSSAQIKPWNHRRWRGHHGLSQRGAQATHLYYGLNPYCSIWGCSDLDYVVKPLLPHGIWLLYGCCFWGFMGVTRLHFG